MLAISSLREDFASLVRRHVGAFRPDPEAIADKLASLDADESDPLQAMQQAFSDPAVLLGAVQSPEQRELQPSLDAAAAAVIGYVDYMVDGVSVKSPQNLYAAFEGTAGRQTRIAVAFVVIGVFFRGTAFTWQWDRLLGHPGVHPGT